MNVFRFIFVIVLLCSIVVVTGCSESTTDPAEPGPGVRGDAVPEGDTNGGLVDVGDCKQTITGIPTVSASSDQDCIEYWYDGGGVLRLKHVNAAFNCCPVVAVDIRVEGTTITIEEIEIEGHCLCLCLYDVIYEIQDLDPGVYDLHVIEPHLPPGDPVLEFTMDLTTEPSGNYCVLRSGYPWGF
jgi:hypothetical protein